MKLNYDYITDWETEQRGRAARRVRRRAARQGDGRRRRGRRGDLPRRRRDHRHGVAAVRRRPLGRHDRRSRARVRRRPRAQPLPRRAVRDSPERRGGVGLCRSPTTSTRAVAEIEWLAEQPGIRGIMIPTMWRDHAPYNDPDYDPVWAACQAANFPVHTHSGEAPQEEMNDFIGIYLAEVVWWTAPPDRAPAVQRRVRALPRPEVRRHRGAPATGSPT